MPTTYQRSVLNEPIPFDVALRFWPKVQVTTSDGCWEWTAFCTSFGHGMLRVVGKMELAHRVSWAIHHGPLPSGVHVLHICDNPPCVNPGHLFLGDNEVNIADKVNKGRSSVPQPKRRGEGHPLAKLSWADVAAIRSAWSGAYGQGRRLADQYGVSPATITNVVKRKVWRDDGPGHPDADAPPAASGRPTDGVRRQGH